MFSALIFAAAAVAVLGIVVALDGSRDVFHPLVFICPMFLFLYVWMPWKLNAGDGLLRYFDIDQLLFIQRLNVIGIAAFVGAAFTAGVRVKRSRPQGLTLSAVACRRLLIGAAVTGSIGFLCWGISIHNVGGFVHAYSASYAGGWDDSGYVRDGSLLMLVGILLAIAALSAGAKSFPSALLIGIFTLPVGVFCFSLQIARIFIWAPLSTSQPMSAPSQTSPTPATNTSTARLPSWQRARADTISGCGAIWRRS
jgi:hypothetical protein